ncbi:hypothetical protein ASZ84_03732 [Vibrio cholerae]|uniref:Uncharacterized protein n=1 Tax=Vibrio cholerae serotype O1 (strain ATCC 39541 / Classical Ogawa 395 / O395) TaxID=345073 RepID=A0A0H3AG69_VIBC3|nr:hypothetical protein VC0395_0280 [Vibrio cholerae O395]APF58910.1 hypothetical protein ASZ81_03824 [Vibrio cholerae]EHH93878.1 hypothetical protein VCHC33A2_3416 [Vibrio cholerae HC-33A2]EHI07664.1 hypothetical protein VCHC61A1_0740 [Vibrio cholerae HC-61A1]EJH35724.1 hypothetical protein VCCP103811_1297 [Vibrio cholerae CP1038(11)]EJH46190.1 hypothetical protein VCCP104821_1941 [Vibrio cholerae CP1048(21)]ELT26819.1 hypothetical protein VCHC7A1_00960 [Vibrio cholerae HC-7A1]
MQILILQFAIEIAFRHSFMSVVVMKLFVFCPIFMQKSLMKSWHVICIY